MRWKFFGLFILAHTVFGSVGWVVAEVINSGSHRLGLEWYDALVAAITLILVLWVCRAVFVATLARRLPLDNPIIVLALLAVEPVLWLVESHSAGLNNPVWETLGPTLAIAADGVFWLAILMVRLRRTRPGRWGWRAAGGTLLAAGAVVAAVASVVPAAQLAGGWVRAVVSLSAGWATSGAVVGAALGVLSGLALIRLAATAPR